MDAHTLTAFGLALLAGLATAVGGGLAVAGRKRVSMRFLATSLGFSAGVMLYVAFVELLRVAEQTLTGRFGDTGQWWTVVGFFGGILLIGVIDRLVPAAINPHELSGNDEESDAQRGRMLRTGLFTAGALAIHNFPEGFAVFLAAGQEASIAIPVVVAAAIHNIPEGIAVAVPVAYATGSRLQGFGYSLLSGLAEPIGALVGFLVLQAFLGPVTMAFAFAAVAGIMVFVCLDELLPAAHDIGHHHATIYGLVAGMAAMAVSLVLV